jgi:hypothetical protein
MGMNINKWLSEHKVSCKYGAPLGDRGDRGDPDTGYKFHLQRIIFVGGDYDKAGTYWGGGRGTDPLYGYMGYDEDGRMVRGFVRAENRAEAKEMIRSDYPNARFYR